MNFDDYITSTCSDIKKHRRDITPDNATKLMEANAPFELQPEQATNKACLLIHGLYDSPHTMRDLANVLTAKGYLVRAILLPGHGTNPDDLHHIKLEQWQAEVSRHVGELSREFDHVALLGFSAGGGLALDYVLSNPKTPIAHLILIAPAIQILSRFAPLLMIVSFLGKWISPLRWIKRMTSRDYARYTFQSSNGAYQVYRLTRRLRKLKLCKLPPSLFIVSDDDMVISPHAIHRLFQFKHDTNKHQLYRYGKKVRQDHGNIRYRVSSYPELDILDFSHLTLCVSPKNPHWGMTPDFEQYIEHYVDNKNAPLKYGESNARNLRHYRMIRLKYNPDFEFMAQVISDFLR